MAIDAVQTTEKLRVSQVVSENTQQTVVRGKITVPEPKPDVEKILSTDKTAKIKKIEILSDKVLRLKPFTKNIEVVILGIRR